jgi:flagellar basal body-associated protein FliL
MEQFEKNNNSKEEKKKKKVILAAAGAVVLAAAIYLAYTVVPANNCTNTTCINGYKFVTLPILGKTCVTCK